MMRLACLFVACTILLAPIATRAAKDGDAPAKTKSAQKKASKKKPPVVDKTARPTKITRTIRPGALTVNVGREINEDVHVVAFPSFPGHAKKALAQNRPIS